MAMDYSGFEKMLSGMIKLQQSHEVFIRSFLKELGLRALAQTKKLTPVGYGNLINLRNRWELSDVFRQGDELYIVLFNATKYALFVEEGHMQHARWVPGKWEGNKFRYMRGAKTGMMLTTRWVSGFHMARISVTKVEMEMPARYNRAFTQFVKSLSLL